MKPPDSDTTRDYAQRILRVIVHIQQNLDAAMPLEELARIAHFSEFHFHRVFRGMVGESVMSHIRRLRLERAAQRLKHTDQPITMIAFEAGYEAHESFTRAFNKAFKCSPTEFRKVANAPDQIDSPGQVHYMAADSKINFHPITIKERPMDVKIKTIKPMRVAFARHVGPYNEVGKTWERLMDWAGSECIFGPETRLLGACWDDPEVTEQDKIRYDACLTVDENFKPTGDIGVQTLGGGQYAAILHEGPYDKLGDTYSALFGRWLAASKHEPDDPPSLEFYLNEPDSTEPEDLLTEVCIRIR